MSSVKLYQQVANAISPQLRHLVEPPVAAPIAPVEAPRPPLQKLRRTGERPFIGHISEVATSSGYSTELPFWYEVNVYRTPDDSLVTDIRLFNKNPNMTDLFRVREHEDMEAVFAYFESYDASADLTPGRDVSSPTASSAALALSAARLQLQVNQLTRHYEAMIGDLLQALNKYLD
jgi:hypothetical protein